MKRLGTAAAPQRTVVLGIGNFLPGDDGVIVHVVEELRCARGYRRPILP